MDSATWLLIGVGLLAAVVATWLIARRRDGGGAELNLLTAKLTETQAGLAGRLSQMADSQQAAQTQSQPCALYLLVR